MNNPLIDYTILQKELEESQDNRVIEWKKFQEAEKEYRDSTVSFFDKISFYSAGIISLSITFLGYLLSQEKLILLSCFFKIPIYYFLYISWPLLMLALIAGLLVRRNDAFHNFFSCQCHYYKSEEEFHNKKTEFLEVYPHIISKNNDIEKDIEICKNNSKRLKEDIICKLEKNENKYFKYYTLVQKISVITFVLGIFFLLLFTIFSTYKIINLHYYVITS